MAAARRVQVLQSHLQSNIETLNRGGAAPSGPAATQLVTESIDRPKWMLPLMLCAAFGGAGVAAYKKRDRIMEKALPAAMKVFFSLSKGASSEEYSQRQELARLDAILSTSESVTPTLLARFRGALVEVFPAEQTLNLLKSQKGLSREEKVSRMKEMQVFVLGRWVSAVYLLCLVHFVTRAVHALNPPTEEEPVRDHECGKLLSDLNVVGLARMVGRFCQSALESNKVAPDSKIRPDKLLRVMAGVRRDVGSVLRLQKGGENGDKDLGPLHEVVLGAEKEGENGDKLRLRDLLAAEESKSVLADCISEFYAVLAQHLEEAFDEVTGGDAAARDLGVSCLKLFMKLIPVFERVFDGKMGDDGSVADNEYLSALKGSDGDSTSDVFFLDLFQLQIESREARGKR